MEPARNDGVATRLDLRGYRWWRVGLGGWLRSPWQGRMRWRPGFNEASCRAHRTMVDRAARRLGHPEPIPADVCRCGFYAMHDLPDEGRWPGLPFELRLESSGCRHSLIFGVARAAGGVLLGRNGWRAQRAEVVALFAGQDPVVNIGRLSERYGVPVYRTIDALATEWGPAGEATPFLHAA